MTMLDKLREMEAGAKLSFSDINNIVLGAVPEKESERQVYMISLSRAAKHFYGVKYFVIDSIFESSLVLSGCKMIIIPY